MKNLTDKEKIELVLESLEWKIKKHVKETILDEQDDLAQEIRIKIMEKLPELLDQEAPGFIDFTKKIK